MTQVLLHIENKKKWNAIKTVLEAMDIDYATQQPAQSMEERELALFHKAESDVAAGRVKSYTNNRDILGL